MQISKSFFLQYFSTLLLAATGCGGSATTPGASAIDNSPSGDELRNAAPIFADVTSGCGVDFVHDPGSSGDRYAMPRTMGSGGGVLDYDGDGRLDIYLLQNAGRDSEAKNRLYRQNADGRFVDVSAGSGLDIAGQGMGFAVGDVDNDGRVDVLVSEYGRTRLFANRSEGAAPRFVDIGESAGIDNPFWGTSCSFVDYDRDGWLDVVVVNYLDYDPSRTCFDGRGRPEFCGPDNFPGRVTKLYRNVTGEAESASNRVIRFSDQTAASGLSARPGPGLGVFCADFDGDRWPDIFVANDGKPNHLWLNRRDGTFEEAAVERGVAMNAMGKSEANMGIAVGDIDGNGLFDIFVTHLTSETHTLWVQDQRGFFQDRTVAAGVTTSWRATGFGAVMADFDNDADADLALVNGKVERGPGGPTAATKLDEFWDRYAERNQLFLNDGRGVLHDVSDRNPPFSELAAVSRGLICADLDNDGGMDLVVTRIAQSAAVFRNVVPQRGHWLTIRAVDPKLRRDAYGAEIHVRAGSLKRMRWINPGYSYLCSNDPRAHFGLGAAERYDAIDVIWPDGVEETFPGGEADRQVVLRRGEGKLAEPVAD
jgi:hypothetical protein